MSGETEICTQKLAGSLKQLNSDSDKNQRWTLPLMEFPLNTFSEIG